MNWRARLRSNAPARSGPPAWPATCASTVRSAPAPLGCATRTPTPTSRGARYLSQDEISDHLLSCTRAGLQGGFHCIGDDAVAAAVEGLRQAARVLGPEPIRAARHRLEHLEMVSEGDLETLAALGVVASVQPAFDAAWGRPGELYQQRLGPDRAATMNPFGTLQRRGVPLAFGTDAPVTPLAGWGMVRDAVNHSREPERMALADAFDAATRGAHWAAFADRAGLIEVGWKADLAIWDVDPDQLDPASGLPDSGGRCATARVRGHGRGRNDSSISRRVFPQRPAPPTAAICRPPHQICRGRRRFHTDRAKPTRGRAVSGGSQVAQVGSGRASATAVRERSAGTR